MKHFITPALLLIATVLSTSCDWDGDDTTPEGIFGTGTGSVRDTPSPTFIEVDVNGTYTGILSNGVTDATSGTDKATLNIGVSGDSVSVLDDLGNGYTGNIGTIRSEITGATDPIVPENFLASRQINFSGFDASAGLNVDFTGSIQLHSNGLISVANGGTIATKLSVVGTWVENGGVTANVDAELAGPNLNLADYPFVPN